METVEHFKGSELIPRIIYNSICPTYLEEELECIKNCGVKTAVVMPFSTKTVRPKGRVKLLNDSLLAAAERSGVENILVDAGMLDIPSISWSSKAIWDIKDKTGIALRVQPVAYDFPLGKDEGKRKPFFRGCCGHPVSSSPNCRGRLSILWSYEKFNLGLSCLRYCGFYDSLW